MLTHLHWVHCISWYIDLAAIIATASNNDQYLAATEPLQPFLHTHSPCCPLAWVLYGPGNLGDADGPRRGALARAQTTQVRQGYTKYVPLEPQE